MKLTCESLSKEISWLGRKAREILDGFFLQFVYVMPSPFVHFTLIVASKFPFRITYFFRIFLISFIKWAQPTEPSVWVKTSFGERKEGIAGPFTSMTFGEIQMFSSYCEFLFQKLVHQRGEQRMDKTTHLLVARKSAKALFLCFFDFPSYSFSESFLGFD